MNHRRCPSRAFTLLEVIVALAMAGVILASLYVSLSTAFRARQRTLDRLDAGRSARLALESMGRQLQSALPPVGVLAGAFVGLDQRHVGGGDGDRVSFYCTGHARVGVGDTRQVTFELSETEDEPGRGFALLRRVHADLLAPLIGATADSVICRGVMGLNVRYFDGFSWLDEWDSTTRDNALPYALELTLETAPPADRPDEPNSRLTRLFVLPCAAIPPDDAEDSTTVEAP